ncbi:hypothetical protein MB84_05040 [Pandoraea oxalativorans]|uniref:Uncharacterized protein n=1 Tax=Pandoraea oxalativorans TaxID=573737 RepID=A0A0E3Y9C6_9BURK|nr:hypothetical protein MB84_05040 [Pandoraea oxalativorans]
MRSMRSMRTIRSRRDPSTTSMTTAGGRSERDGTTYQRTSSVGIQDEPVFRFATVGSVRRDVL